MPAGARAPSRASGRELVRAARGRLHPAALRERAPRALPRRDPPAFPRGSRDRGDRPAAAPSYRDGPLATQAWTGPHAGASEPESAPPHRGPARNGMGPHAGLTEEPPPPHPAPVVCRDRQRCRPGPRLEVVETLRSRARGERGPERPRGQGATPAPALDPPPTR